MPVKFTKSFEANFKQTRAEPKARNSSSHQFHISKEAVHWHGLVAVLIREAAAVFQEHRSPWLIRILRGGPVKAPTAALLFAEGVIAVQISTHF